MGPTDRDREESRLEDREAAKPPTFTLDEVFAILRNMGHDVSCDACMAIALTGVGLPGDKHTCARPNPAVRDAWAQTLRQLRATLECCISREERRDTYACYGPSLEKALAAALEPSE